MASTYTVNLGIEKIGTGEQSGTWGTTTNTNFDLIDQAVNGAVAVTLASAGTSGSPNTLAITNGATSDGRNKFIDFADGGDLGATAYVQLDPNDAEKLVHIRNSLSGGRSLILFQGTYNASNDFEVPNGKDVVLKFDGAGASATVTDVFTDLQATAITTPDLTATTADINGGTIDGVTIGGSSAGAITGTTITGTSFVSSGDMTFGDNDKAIFGAGSDLQIYHDGSNSYVADVGTGRLFLSSDGDGVNIVTSTGENLIRTDNNGQVRVYFDDAEKLRTNSTGIDVTGTAVMDALTVGGTLGNFDISAGGNQATFDYNGFNYINSTGAGSALVFRMGSTSANALRLDSNGGVIVNDDGGDQDFRVESDSNTNMLFVDAGADHVCIGTNADMGGLLNIKGRIAFEQPSQDLDIYGINPTGWGYSTGAYGVLQLGQSGNNGGTVSIGYDPSSNANGSFTGNGSEMLFANGIDFVTPNAADNEFLYQITMGDSGVVINESSRDLDFRVESDNNADMLVVDAGNNAVGVGMSGPTNPLTVAGTGNSSFSSAKGIVVDYQASSTSNVLPIGFSWSNSVSNQNPLWGMAFVPENHSSGTGGISLYTGGDKRVNVLSTGNVELTGGALSFTKADGVSINAAESLVINIDSDNNDSGRVFQTQTGAGLVMMTNSESFGSVFNEGGADLDFRVESDSNTHAFYVDAGNNAKIGIGTSTPQSVNDAACGISIGDGSGSGRIQLTSDGGGCVYAGTDPVNSSTTGFRMGHLNGTNRLEMSVNNSNSYGAGVVLSAGGTSWGTFSDERRKTDLVEISGGLDKVATLRAVTGRYTNDDENVRRPMLIAQDVQAVLPEAVGSMTASMDDPTEYLTLNYTETIPLLVSALKDAKQLIETLEARVATLEAK